MILATMADSTSQDLFELKVTDFGPIIEARIDLRPLTVFIGPSNTGKSYLAILLYALHRYFNEPYVGRRRRIQRNSRKFGHNGNRKSPPQSLVEISKAILENPIEYRDESGNCIGGDIHTESIILSDPVVDILRSRCGEQGGYLGDEISRCFGLEKVGALIRRGAKGAACIVCRKRGGNGDALVNHRLTLHADVCEFEAMLPKGAQIRVAPGADYDDDQEVYDDCLYQTAANMTGNTERFLDALIRCIHPPIDGSLLGIPAFYLPADRSGVMHAHNVVVNALIGSGATTGLRPATRMPMLSGMLADFLAQLSELGAAPNRSRGSRHDLDVQLEKAILGGSIGVDGPEVINYPHFTYKPKGWRGSLPLTNVSSMVSELAPVVLYLRYLVGIGDLLIIEEPEAHLHPAMQVEFTRQIAALVEAGIRVLITTHSEWVLEELANIVRRSELSSPAENTTAGADIALRPDQVGAWLFKPKQRPRGSIVEEVKLDAETGLYPTDYDDVSEALYNENVDIFNRIHSLPA